MNKFKTLIFFSLALLATNPLFAQVEMADKFRADGKIYVVIAIILIILAGVFVYLFLVDRKVKKLEDRFNEKHQTK